MIIGFYLGTLTPATGGMYPYAARVLDMLARHAKAADLTILVFCSPAAAVQLKPLAMRDSDVVRLVIPPPLRQPRWPLLRLLLRLPWRLLNRLWPDWGLRARWLSWLNPDYHWLARSGIDLLHVPSPVAPADGLPFPVIVTMHDLQELHFPEFFTPAERLWRARLRARAMAHADAIIVSFDHVKDDFRRWFPDAQQQVKVCPLPYAHITYPGPGLQEAADYQAELGPMSPFLLYPARTWEHKNHLSLFRALEWLKRHRHRDLTLICTGASTPFRQSLDAFLATSPIQNRVHFLGLVPSTQLCWLYQNCALVVIPTLYEAGSFPLLEAMALGAPVICSSATSLPATMGDDRFVFDPLNSEQMARRIVACLDDPHLRSANRANGRSRMAALTGHDPFPTWLDLYQSLLM